MSQQELNFRVSAALKNIIGRDLITDDYIAVFELVKNSYDAHATEIKITFDHDKIVIEDNGKGMSFQDLRDKWLFVAYSAKKEGVEDDDLDNDDVPEDYRNKIQAKRHYAGAKGIGRFSCDRLGSELFLTTRKIGANSRCEQLYVDWSKFESDPEQKFVEISVLHETLQKGQESYRDHAGTTLEISSLNSKWSRDKLLKLRRSLEKLINPLDTLDSTKKTPSLLIELIASAELEGDEKVSHEAERINGPIRNFIFEKLQVKTTLITTTVTPEAITTELIDRGTRIFKIVEKSGIPENLRRINDLDLRFKVFFLNKAAKSAFTRQMKVRNRDFGSIFLFKNGFRVYPIGEPGDDSFGIDRKKSQGYSRNLGTRELLGRIEIFSESPKFREVSSRSGGMVKTEEYDQLIKLFKTKCLERLSRYVIDITWATRNKRDKDQEDTSLLENLDDKTRIISMLSKMFNSEAITVEYYNRKFIDILDERLENAAPEIFENLRKIAEASEDEDFGEKILSAEDKYLRLLEEKNKADERAYEAELKLQEEKEKNEVQEQRLWQVEKEKAQTELRLKQARNQRKEAELRAKEDRQRKKEAELKAKEAEVLAERERQEKEKARIQARDERIKRQEIQIRAETLEKEAKTTKTQLRWLQSIQTLDLDHVITLQHQIGIDANTVMDHVLDFRRTLDEEDPLDKDSIMEYLEAISFAAQKILATTRFTTKKGVLQASRETEADLIQFMKDYIDKIYRHLGGKRLAIEYKDGVDGGYTKLFKPIEISMIIDNLLSNSRKMKANQVFISFSKEGNGLLIEYKDNGRGLDSDIQPESIFERGVTTTNGSGLGLFHVSSIVRDMGGSISVGNRDSGEKGIIFKIKL